MKVSLTRMELLRLRKRLDLAVRGHKLLEDKLEGLVGRFLRFVAEYRRQHAKVSREIVRVLGRFTLAASLSSEETVARALLECRGETDVELKFTRLLNVPIPTLAVKEYRLDLSYSLVETPMELDAAVSALQTLFLEILKLAQLQETVWILAVEIAKTRRRVNSLRYIIIPQLAATIKQIKTRFEELDREAKSQLLKIKEMLAAR